MSVGEGLILMVAVLTLLVALSARFEAVEARKIASLAQRNVTMLIQVQALRFNAAMASRAKILSAVEGTNVGIEKLVEILSTFSDESVKERQH